MKLGFKSRAVDEYHPLARWAAWGVGLLLIVAGLIAASMASSEAAYDLVRR